MLQCARPSFWLHLCLVARFLNSLASLNVHGRLRAVSRLTAFPRAWGFAVGLPSGMSFSRDRGESSVAMLTRQLLQLLVSWTPNLTCVKTEVASSGKCVKVAAQRCEIFQLCLTPLSSARLSRGCGAIDQVRTGASNRGESVGGPRLGSDAGPAVRAPESRHLKDAPACAMNESSTGTIQNSEGDLPI